MYKKCKLNVVMFLILYIDDILLIKNVVGVLSSIKIWLAYHFDMKDLGEIIYILGFKFVLDRQNKIQKFIPNCIYR